MFDFKEVVQKVNSVYTLLHVRALSLLPESNISNPVGELSADVSLCLKSHASEVRWQG